MQCPYEDVHYLRTEGMLCLALLYFRSQKATAYQYVPQHLFTEKAD